ncbi:MAG: glycosyltransferase, partial [Paracoccaceae bacterium]
MTDAAQSVAPGWVMPRRVVYVVDHSLPFSSDGYAVRTHEVARGLSELGHEVIVITRPGRPWDMKGFPKTRAIQQDRMLDGVRYVFLPHEGLPVSGLRNRQRAAERTLLSAFEIFRPGVVLAASSWENAEPAQYAARRWGVPFFFEQRGFWEMSEATRNPDYAQTPEFEATRQAELRVARAAAGVFTLNSAMKAELVRRGLEINKIHIAANGMRRSPASAIPVTREGVGSRAQHLIGYIGSLSPYEGTDVLIEALGHLRAGGLDVDALIVGSGNPAGLVGGTEADPFVSGVMAQATRAGLAEHVIHCPRVPQDQISGYYGILEAMVMPRRRSDMTELVAPMKPYAAAAHGVPVVMSDLPPLREIATDIDATLFAEGDAKALAARLRDLLTPNPSSVPAPTTPPITSAPAIPHALTWAVRMQAMSRILQQAVPMQRAAGAVFAQIQPGAATHSPNGHVAPVAGG